MRFCLGLMLLWACNSESAARPALPPTQIAGVPPKVAVKPARVTRAPQTGAHGSEITGIAATPDGAAVVSVDRLGGIRLWPALDGTREPVVLRGAAARGLTIARDGDGFVVGMLDDAGGVRIVRTDALGAQRSSTAIDHAVRALEIESTSEGVVILWADQTVALVSPSGATRATLTPEPGAQVDTLLARSGRVLALVREDKQLRGRWLITDRDGARWGDATGALPSKLAHVVLSPDGTRIAGTLPDSAHPLLIDVATGTRLPTPLCVTKGWPSDEGMDTTAREVIAGGNAPFPLGFLSDRVVACNVSGSLVWWTARGAVEPSMVPQAGFNQQAFAVSSRALLVARGPSLGISSPTEARYLGYGVHDVTALRTGPGGTVVAGEQRVLYVDGALGERSPLDIGRFKTEWSDLVPLDDRYAVTLQMRRRSGDGQIGELSVYDVAGRVQRQLLPYEISDERLSYEPATRLLAASAPTGAMLLAYDPAKHVFGAPAKIATAFLANRLVVVDPAQAGGVAALQVDSLADGVEIGEIALADVKPGAEVAPRASYRVPGSLRAIDRAGRVYAHGAKDGDDVVVYTRGKPTARLRGMAPFELRPSADGARIAGFLSPRLALARADGAQLWETAQWSASDLAWAPDGGLVVQLPSAIAHVDLATGALVDRRCGLAFGLTDAPLDGSGNEASACDAVN